MLICDSLGRRRLSLRICLLHGGGRSSDRWYQPVVLWRYLPQLLLDVATTCDGVGIAGRSWDRFYIHFLVYGNYIVSYKDIFEYVHMVWSLTSATFLGRVEEVVIRFRVRVFEMYISAGILRNDEVF